MPPFNCVQGLTLWEGVWKGGSDQNSHLGSGQKKLYCNCFQNMSLNVHFKFIFADLFLVPFLLTQTSVSQAFPIAAVLLYPREENQEIIEFCKGKEVFLSTCEAMCQMVVLNEAGVPVPGKLVSALTICHVTYQAQLPCLSSWYRKSIVSSLINSAWKVPASMASFVNRHSWHEAIRTEEATFCRTCQGHPLQKRIWQSSAHIFPPGEECMLNSH